jgi:hypothetical protein
MQRIFAPVGDLGVDRAVLSLAPAAASASLSVEACLVEVWRIMRNSHSFEAEIDTDNLLSVGGGWTLNRNDKIAIPTAARIPVEAAGFKLAVDSAEFPDAKALAT